MQGAQSDISLQRQFFLSPVLILPFFSGYFLLQNWLKKGKIKKIALFWKWKKILIVDVLLH